MIISPFCVVYMMLWRIRVLTFFEKMCSTEKLVRRFKPVSVFSKRTTRRSRDSCVSSLGLSEVHFRCRHLSYCHMYNHVTRRFRIDIEEFYFDKVDCACWRVGDVNPHPRKAGRWVLGLLFHKLPGKH